MRAQRHQRSIRKGLELFDSWFGDKVADGEGVVMGLYFFFSIGRAVHALSVLGHVICTRRISAIDAARAKKASVYPGSFSDSQPRAVEAVSRAGIRARLNLPRARGGARVYTQ